MQVCKTQSKFNASSCLCTALPQIRTGTLLGANSITACTSHTLPITPLWAAQASPCWLECPRVQSESTRLVNNPKKPLPNFCPFSDSVINSITIFYKHVVKNIFYWQPKKKKKKKQPCGKSRVRRSGYLSWLCFFRCCD